MPYDGQGERPDRGAPPCGRRAQRHGDTLCDGLTRARVTPGRQVSAGSGVLSGLAAKCRIGEDFSPDADFARRGLETPDSIG